MLSCRSIKIKWIFFIITILLCLNTFLSPLLKREEVFALPFYDLKPKESVLRAQFYTTYKTSTLERKHNIKLASSSLNNTFVDVGKEFSFNQTVGERTEKRGYKNSKIIVGGEFVDGVGGGVCQVSTTLYNALLLAGLKIIEYHPHSLSVSYVAPSFDAMVNSNTADLKFINNTHNPIIIKTVADGEKIKVEIYGEEMQEKYFRKSEIINTIEPPEYEVVFDEKGEFPDLYEGESRVMKYQKEGCKSVGYLIVIKNGVQKGIKKIRSDSYAPIRGKIVYGKAVKEQIELNKNKKILLNDIKNFDKQ
jgi:hypothetical protein